MLKNVSLRKREVNGQATWVLVGPDGTPIPAFTAYAHSLRNAAKNTLDSYCHHLAEFLDYLIEASTIQGGTLTKPQLSDTIEAYGDYLVLGTGARSSIAREVAAKRPPNINSATSLGPKRAAIQRFLRLSEEVRREMLELEAANGRGQENIDEDPLMPDIGKRRKLRPSEIRAMQVNSMLAGVIAGGPKFIDCVILKGSTDATDHDESRAFPYDRVIDLIDSLTTYRDKSLYALLAACGCRTHEGLQLLMEDIDVQKAELRLVDPKTRIGHQSYRTLNNHESSLLAWKGRATQSTLMIEPFASKFFECLEKYFLHERIAHERHEFVFQYIRGPKIGKPYFLSAATSRLEPFHRACDRVGVELPPRTAAHSLRHMYGTYLLNYFPRADGSYGLPPAMVQQLMGHSSLKSTMKYARYDRDLFKLELANANQVIFSKNTPKTLTEQKVAALEFELSRLRDQIRQEAIPHDKFEP